MLFYVKTENHKNHKHRFIFIVSIKIMFYAENECESRSRPRPRLSGNDGEIKFFICNKTTNFPRSYFQMFCRLYKLQTFSISYHTNPQCIE